MRVERIHNYENSHYPGQIGERIDQERKKTFTKSAVSFEEERSNNQQPEHEKEKDGKPDKESPANDPRAVLQEVIELGSQKLDVLV